MLYLYLPFITRSLFVLWLFYWAESVVDTLEVGGVIMVDRHYMQSKILLHFLSTQLAQCLSNKLFIGNKGRIDKFLPDT